MNGSNVAFTNQYGIRNNINKIGYERIKALLLKTLIEKGEYNRRVLHQLSAQNFQDECADYVTNIAYYGQLEKNEEWITTFTTTFIDVYVEEKYKKEYGIKVHEERMCYENSLTTKALEQLNLQMSLNRIK